jgi:cytochrome c
MNRRFILAACAGLTVALAGCSSGGEGQSSGNATTEASAPAGDPNAAFASLKGDVANGEKVYARCAACHSLEAGKNGLGPSLHGVVGREAGKVAGFNYSPANVASHMTWTGDALFTYLKNPREVMPGTKMSFAGISEPQQRADVIAYLETKK